MTLGVAAVVAGGAVVGFLLGSVNPATAFARLLRKDLSTSGSGNPGATNAGRVLGARWGVVVAVLDVLKGFGPAYLLLVAVGTVPAYITGVAAVLGHVYSPFLRGRGGKGVATTLGVVLAVQPWFALVMVVVFGVVLAIGRWVAGASLAAAAMLVALGVAAGAGLLPGSWATTIWAAVLAGIVGLRHDVNIRAWLRARGQRRADPSDA
ncbi:MAG: glycerol-3-phosphate acyltransferase [Actinomycetota bacterium]|nr:glycerol-3-phosphate acyltransferase [Actinomycetota bacterium]